MTHGKYIHVAVLGAGEPAKSTGLVQHKVVVDQNIDQIKGPIWWIINFTDDVFQNKCLCPVSEVRRNKKSPSSFGSLHFAESVR